MYKLRIYYTVGYNKGNLKAEEYFNTLEEMKSRYDELFKYDLFGLNPTAWRKTKEGYKRIAGY